MGVEIERKYLVANSLWQARVESSFHITQGYLSRGEGASIRIRLIDDAAVVTRFLFVFCHAKHRPDPKHDIDSTRQPLMGEIEACVQGVLRQTRPGEASGACE